jgi:hypothetical protein
MAINLSSMDVVSSANKGAPIQIFHPTTGESIGLYIFVLGKDSKIFRDITTEQMRKRLRKVSRNGSSVIKFDAVSQGELDADAVDALVAVTKGWYSDAAATKPESIHITGESPEPFSVDSCTRLYTSMPWIREQVDIAVGERANFTVA